MISGSNNITNTYTPAGQISFDSFIHAGGKSKDRGGYRGNRNRHGRDRNNTNRAEAGGNIPNNNTPEQDKPREQDKKLQRYQSLKARLSQLQQELIDENRLPAHIEPIRFGNELRKMRYNDKRRDEKGGIKNPQALQQRIKHYHKTKPWSKPSDLSPAQVAGVSELGANASMPPVMDDIPFEAPGGVDIMSVDEEFGGDQISLL